MSADDAVSEEAVEECRRIKAYVVEKVGEALWPSDRFTQESLFETLGSVVSRPSRRMTREQVLLCHLVVKTIDITALSAGRPCRALGSVQRARSGKTPMADALRAAEAKEAGLPGEGPEGGQKKR